MSDTELLDNAMVASLNGSDQATRLADIVARTGLDPWDAHAAAIADVAICPILILNAAKWREHAADLDEPLHIVEICRVDDWDGLHISARIAGDIAGSGKRESSPYLGR